MADTVTVTVRSPDPVTTFLTDLYELGPVAWAAIALASRERDAQLWEWDAAYEAALDAGGDWAAKVAARAAEAAGSGHRAAAVVAGAAAALAARESLEVRQFDLLHNPVAEVLPGRRRGRTGADHDAAVYTTCMPNTNRPLPA